MMFTLGAWILGLLLLVLFFSKLLDDRTNPNRSVATSTATQYQEIVLQRNPYGHYVFDGEINQKPVTFLVDTGATTTAIPAQLQDYLQLETGPSFTVTTANGRATAYSTRLNELKMGEIVFQDTRASINPGMKNQEILLGMNILKHMELIQHANELIIRRYY